MVKIKKKRLVEAALICIAVIWSLNFTVIKNSLAEIGPFTFNGLRFLLATAFMWGVLLWRGQWVSVPRKDWLPIFFTALLGDVIYQFLFIYGMNLTMAANAAVMLGTIPIWVALISHFSGQERMNIYKLFGVIFAFAGIALIMAGGGKGFSFVTQTFTGDLMILGAALMLGAYTVITKSFLERYNPIQFTTIATTIGTVILFVFAIPGILQTNWSTVSAAAYGGIFYSGLLAIGTAFLVWNYGIQTLGAVHTSTFQNLVPVLGVIFGMIILNEQLTTLQLIGSAIVVIGIVLSRKN